MAGFEQIQEALLNQNEESLIAAHRILDHFAENLAYDVGYLMDSSGKTIASSNRNQTDSFVGQNYSFRPYFTETIQGRPSIYLAVGVTSGIRGIYFSHPVYRADGGTPIGVAVIKVSTHDLDSEFSRFRTGTQLLVDKRGMIFVSNREDWTLNLLWRVSPEELSQIDETQQFGKGPWDWTGLEKKADNHAVDGSGEEYLIHEMSLENCPGWRIVSLYSVKEISGKFVDPLVGKTGYVALILFVLVGGAVVVLYVVAQRDILSRKQAEEEVQKLASVVKYSSELVNLATLDGKMIFINDAGSRMLGIDPAEAAHTNIMEVIPDHLKDKVQTELLPALMQNHTWEGELQYLNLKTGELTDVHVMTFTVQDPVTGMPLYLANVSLDITERKRGEEELKKSLSLLNSTLESTADGILVVDSEGKIVVFNQRFVEMWQIPQNVVESRDDDKALAFVPSQLTNPEAFLEKVRELYNQPELDSFDVIEFKDGRVFERYSLPQRIGDKVFGRVWSFRDVTEQKRTEETRTIEKQRFQRLAENSPFGMVMIQPDGSFSYANPKFREMFGYDPGDVPNGREWFRKAYPDAGYRHKVISAWMEDVNDHTLWETRPRVFTVTCKDGTEKMVHFRPVKLGSGEDLMTCEDITTRGKAENALIESEERYRAMFSYMKSGVAVYRAEDAGMDFSFVDFSPSAERISRIKKDALIGQRLLDKFPNMDRTGLFAALQRVYRTGVSEHLPAFYYKDADREGWRDNFIYKLPSGHVVTIYEDVTERMQAEQAVRESEEKYRSLFEDSIDGIFITATDGTLIDANQSFLELFGYNREEIIGASILKTYADTADRNRFRQEIEKRGSVKDYPLRLVKMDGTKIDCLLTATVRRAQDATILGYRGIMRDVTEHKILQQQLLQAQKMEAIGTLAGGVAHDFNNLLQVVLGYSEILLKGKQEGDHDYAGIKKISLAGKRGADLVQSLLTLSRKVEPQLLPVQLEP